MSYLEILAYVSVGIISFSWVLVLLFDTGKKILNKKTSKSTKAMKVEETISE